MQFVSLNVLTYIYRITDSISFCQNYILTEQRKETAWIYYLWVFTNYIKKASVLKKEKQNFDIQEGRESTS